MNMEKIKTLATGAGFGIVATLIVLSMTGWMITASAAGTEARASAAKAMVDSLAPICVAQFEANPENGQKLTELKGVDSWKQYQFVQDQGWSTMPGAEKPSDSDVARECVRLILAAK